MALAGVPRPRDQTREAGKFITGSRLATFKNADTPGQFLTTARAKLAEIAIDGEPQLPLHIEGERSGEPKRRVLRITDQSGTHRSIYGYSLLVTGLTADHSLRLQESGLGGRTPNEVWLFRVDAGDDKTIVLGCWRDKWRRRGAELSSSGGLSLLTVAPA